MIYRFLGKSGLSVSVIGYGNYLTNTKVTEEQENITYECMTKCFEKGINYFDTAEIYGMGAAEIAMGKAIKKAGWERKDFVISTKFFTGGPGVNDGFLSRKHLMEGMEASLKRLQLDHVDVAFAHRYDPETPIEEVCRAFNHFIEKGQTFYWGTSEWTPMQVMEANECCERLNLIKPIVDQPEYNMFTRKKFEVEYADLFDKWGYGSTIFGPLAGGVLSGKYNNGEIPPNSRYAGKIMPALGKMRWERYLDGDKSKFIKKMTGLVDLAEELKCTQAQLSLAWCIVNQDVSVALMGASNAEQLAENLGAIDVVKKWSPEIEARIEKIMETCPEPPLNWRTWTAVPNRRQTRVKYFA